MKKVIIPIIAIVLVVAVVLGVLSVSKVPEPKPSQEIEALGKKCFLQVILERCIGVTYFLCSTLCSNLFDFVWVVFAAGLCITKFDSFISVSGRRVWPGCKDCIFHNVHFFDDFCGFFCFEF